MDRRSTPSGYITHTVSAPSLHGKTVGRRGNSVNLSSFWASEAVGGRLSRPLGLSPASCPGSHWRPLVPHSRRSSPCCSSSCGAIGPRWRPRGRKCSPSWGGWTPPETTPPETTPPSVPSSAPPLLRPSAAWAPPLPLDLFTPRCGPASAPPQPRLSPRPHSTIGCSRLPLSVEGVLGHSALYWSTFNTAASWSDHRASQSASPNLATSCWA